MFVLYVKQLYCQSKLVLTEREKDLPEQEVAAVRADSANFQTKLRAQSVRPSGWREDDQQGKSEEH